MVSEASVTRGHCSPHLCGIFSARFKESLCWINTSSPMGSGVRGRVRVYNISWGLKHQLKRLVDLVPRQTSTNWFEKHQKILEVWSKNTTSYILKSVFILSAVQNANWIKSIPLMLFLKHFAFELIRRWMWMVAMLHPYTSSWKQKKVGFLETESNGISPSFS